MLENYSEMLEELEAELITDSHAHESDVIVSEYIDCAIKAVDVLQNYIKTMNEVYDVDINTPKKLICPTCKNEFKLAKRCPHCGQLFMQ